jgi:membrane associated rhomboid family serine protease
LIPLRDENPSEGPAFVTWGLIAINVAVFFYEFSLGDDLTHFIMRWGLVPARLTMLVTHGASPVLAGLPFLSSMFLHGGWMHLIGNMWYLAISGDNVEDRFGHAGYLVFYLLAGLAGGALHFFFNAGSTLPTVGASAAIAGVLGAYIVAFPRARVMTLVPLFPFLQLMALPAVVVLGLWFVFQFFSGALSLAWAAGASHGGTAWWGHIGGFAFGAITMMIFGRRDREPARAWQA